MPTAVREQINNIDEFYKNNGGDPIEPSETSVKPEGDTAKEPTVATQAPTLGIPDNEEATYEKRFKNYKAQADQKIHTYREQLAQLDAIKNQNIALQSQLQKVAKEQPKFSQEALDSFSSEELDVFDKMVNERTSGLVEQVGRLTKQLNDKQQEEITNKKQEDYLSLKQQVANAVEDFEVIDKSPEFSKWLNELDAYGSLRMDGLRNAQATSDIARIVSFYNDFKQLQVPIQVDPRELQQVPSNTGSTQSNGQTLNKVWDNPSIQKYYKNAALGKYSDEQRNELESDMHNYLMSSGQ